MLGVILAGGRATRLGALTKCVNKHLLPIHDKPMIYYPIQTFKTAGITEILIISSTDQIHQLIQQLGDGSELGVSLTYKIQDVPGGIAHAIRLAESFVGDNDFSVILGDNIFDTELDLRDAVDLFKDRKGPKCHLLFKKVHDPERFGVPYFSDEGTLMGIEEKPKRPRSNLAVTGLYFYDKTIFSIIRGLRPSARGEFEISDVNHKYISINSATYTTFENFWSDAGTIESYGLCNKFFLEKK